MDNYKTVLNRLYKTEEVELKSEKVELGIVDELNKKISQANKSADAINNLQTKLDSSYNNIESILPKFKSNLKIFNKTRKSIVSDKKKADKMWQELFDFIKLIDKQSKELGLNPNQIKGYNEAKDLVDRLRNLSKFTSYDEYNSSDIF